MTTEKNETRADLTAQSIKLLETLPALALKMNCNQELVLAYVENGGTDKAEFERLRKEFLDAVDEQKEARKKAVNLLCKSYAFDSELEVSDI